MTSETAASGWLAVALWSLVLWFPNLLPVCTFSRPLCLRPVIDRKEQTPSGRQGLSSLSLSLLWNNMLGWQLSKKIKTYCLTRQYWTCMRVSLGSWWGSNLLQMRSRDLIILVGDLNAFIRFLEFLFNHIHPQGFQSRIPHSFPLYWAHPKRRVQSWEKWKIAYEGNAAKWCIAPFGAAVSRSRN